MRRWQVPEIHPLSVRPLIRRAVWRMLPPPEVVALAVLLVIVVSDASKGFTWLLALALAACAYAVVHAAGERRFSFRCEPIDHWRGDDDEPPLLDECPYCADVPAWVLLRAALAARKEAR